MPSIRPLSRKPLPGSEFVRTWNRRTYRVVVMEKGFAWEGRTYSSLSEIAFAITGTKWNGPRFFGLRSNPRRSLEPMTGSDRPPCRTAPGISAALRGLFNLLNASLRHILAFQSAFWGIRRRGLDVRIGRSSTNLKQRTHLVGLGRLTPLFAIDRFSE